MRIDQMPTPKIDIVKLDQLLRAGKLQTEIAQFFGVTPSAVSRAKSQLKNRVVRTVALEKANEVVESHLDMMSQLRKINNAINDELDKAKGAAAAAEGKDKLPNRFLFCDWRCLLYDHHECYTFR